MARRIESLYVSEKLQCKYGLRQRDQANEREVGEGLNSFHQNHTRLVQ
jgi:hypothetical protein